jgi:hypothetical protein
MGLDLSVTDVSEGPTQKHRIRTSVIRHSVSDKQPDSRNSSPDAKVAVA